MARHLAKRPIDGWRAIMIGAVVTLAASLGVVMVSRSSVENRVHRTSDVIRPQPLVMGSNSPSDSAPSPSDLLTSPSSSRSVSVKPSRSSAAPSPSTKTASPQPPPPPHVVFSARYQVRGIWGNGYVARVTVTNVGTVTADWAVVLILPDRIRVERYWIAGEGFASGDQSGRTVTFAGRLAAGVSIAVEYQVRRPNDASANPESCRVNGVACG